MSTMKRISVVKPGGYDRLKLEEVPIEKPDTGEVRVRIRAAAVNYADIAVRLGLYSSANEYVGFPLVPGFEYAGTIDELGDGVDDLAVGDPVLGVSFFNSYATHVVVPRHYVFRKPDALSMDQAAAFPSVYITAWYSLCELAHPRPGQTILVHSAAGGVGSALLQVGKVLGCRTIGVVGSPHKVETAKDYGADVVIDKSSQDLWAEVEAAAPRGVDVAMDSNGLSTLKQSFNHLRRPGKLVTYGFASMLPRGVSRISFFGWFGLAWRYLRTPRFDPLKLTNACKSVLAFNLSYLFREEHLLAEGMAQLVSWLEEGKIKSHPVQTFPMENVADAHRAISSGTTVGKLVLRTDNLLD